jgi:metal-sulfur cluster biosynthetic enzyme
LGRKPVNVGNLEAEVRTDLTEVTDPETGLSIMRVDLIHNLSVAPDGSVSFIFRPSSPVCRMAYSLATAMKKRLETVHHIASVTIGVDNFERASHLEGVLQGTNVQGKVD